ncbi:helix-turn-helix domain-containing protein [Leucobacter ruminantium]|uniref:Helix-turn-helix domain-containing protein n=1 Tax=Leucobacter ruminantium TaxID=1289170 RepID=A0A939M3J4_9MICO|nr:helix-turn-helix domain-containing protein [Leucobacter ruminantium]MBO1806325.1 helix-turn-helix domain-containing protein [Leucobacter ruminantium]
MNRLLVLPREIPAVAASQIRNAREPSLIWVHSGEAKVSVGSEDHLLQEGDAIWVPAGLTYGIHAAPGTVAFPIFPAARRVRFQIDAPTRTHFPSEWNDWLIYQFARSIGYLRGIAASKGLASIVVESPGSTPSGTPIPAPPIALPSEPTSDAAARVARRLIEDPGDPATIPELAASVNVSVRTLQKQFVDETGVSIATWRTSVRIAASATFIDLGHDIGWVVQQVGFMTPAGLTRAFQRHTSMTPRDFAKRRAGRRALSDSSSDLPLPNRSDSTQGVEKVETLLPPLVAPSKTWNRINDFHVLVWVYRGTARVEIGERTFDLSQGDAAWLPANESNTVDLKEGSILLPLGSRDMKRQAKGPSVFVQSFAQEDEAFLLHTFVANYSQLRPEPHDSHFITRLFLENACSSTQDARPGANDVSIQASTVLQRVRATPADSRPLSAWAAELGVAVEDLAQEVRSAVGIPFARWRSQLRMTLARHYLEDGLSVAQTSKRLGYAHPSSFTKVFTEQHQMSPSAYWRFGWHQTKESLIVP